MIELMSTTFTNEEDTKEKLCDFIRTADKLSMGEQCRLFEDNFGKWQGRRYSVLFNSGSSANLAILQTYKNLGYLREGDRVGFSALTWSTNVMPIIQMGFIPIPIDININTLNIAVIDENINALFLTNALGLCDDIEWIYDYCHRRGILFIEDCCESLGSEYNSIKLGNFGDSSTFSFYVGHQMSTIEGGMVCTNNYNVYESLKMVRSHGWTRNLDRPDNTFQGKYNFYQLAYNLRPTEITGFLGNNQLQYIDKNINKRDELFRRWNYIIDNQYSINNMNKISNFAFPIISENEKRKNKAINCGLEIRPIIAGDMREQPFYKNKYNGFSCENVNYKYSGFYIPNRPDLTEDEIKVIEGFLGE
jgi:CDP-6-deoxy-D-xylo-4-hexulose-3-dehydrase